MAIHGVRRSEHIARLPAYRYKAALSDWQERGIRRETTVFDLALHKVGKFTLGGGPLLVIPAGSHSNIERWEMAGRSCRECGDGTELRAPGCDYHLFAFLLRVRVGAPADSGGGSATARSLQFQQMLLSPVVRYLEYRSRQSRQLDSHRLRGRQSDAFTERYRNEPLCRTPAVGAPHRQRVADNGRSSLPPRFSFPIGPN